MKRFVLITLLFASYFASLGVILASSVDDQNNLYKEKARLYSNNRSEYISLYNKYKSTCQKDNDGCKELKEQVLEKIKIHLKTSSEAIITYSEALKLRVENSTIDVALKNSFLAEIKNIIDTFNEKIIKIDSIKSSEDVRLISQELRLLWLEKEAIFLKIRLTILLDKIEENNGRLNEFSNKLNNHLLEASEKYDISNLTKKYEENELRIIELNKQIEALKTAINNINKNNISSFKKIKQDIISYKKLTQEVVKDLRLIIFDLKKKDFKEISKADFKDFYIKGEGQIIIIGNFEISGDVGDTNKLGKIEALNSDSVDTFGEGLAVKSGEATVYSDVRRVAIKSKSKITITSSNLDLIIKGNGKISIKGDGLYKVGADGTWSDISADGLEESI
ncbi:hypothetical protein HGB13_03060 [bacterium]|nr:hypothetical protein [bacterium]